MADLQAAVKSPASLGVPKWGAGKPLEGFLFPATYDIAPGTTAKQALTSMVTRFNQEARAISALNYPNIATIYEIDDMTRMPKNPKISWSLLVDPHLPQGESPVERSLAQGVVTP